MKINILLNKKVIFLFKTIFKLDFILFIHTSLFILFTECRGVSGHPND